MVEVDDVKKFILRELTKKRKIGGAHIFLDKVVRHLPDKYFHDKKSRKSIDAAIKDLVNAGWINANRKRTGKGDDVHISINPRMIKKVFEFLS
jgi:hypothetical protein